MDVVTEIDGEHGWSVETALAHVVTMITSADRRYQQRFDEQQEARREAQNEVAIRVDQRFEAEARAVEIQVQALHDLRRELELRHEQRFEAQQRAIDGALSVVGREFQERLQLYQLETKAAQLAAERAMAAALNATEKAIEKQEAATERAILKQEVATERRFESVNEFRQQLSDQAASFIPRKETEQRISAVAEKAEAGEQRLAATLISLGSRLDTMAGARQGGQEVVQDRRQAAAAVYAALGMGITIVLFLIAFAGYLVAKP